VVSIVGQNRSLTLIGPLPLSPTPTEGAMLSYSTVHRKTLLILSDKINMMRDQLDIFSGAFSFVSPNMGILCPDKRLFLSVNDDIAWNVFPPSYRRKRPPLHVPQKPPTLTTTRAWLVLIISPFLPFKVLPPFHFYNTNAIRPRQSLSAASSDTLPTRKFKDCYPESPARGPYFAFFVLVEVLPSTPNSIRATIIFLSWLPSPSSFKRLN